MANPYLGQLSLVGFNFAPVGWVLAAGQILPLSQNTALFSLLGTMYGGDGKSNFGLPNLQNAVPIGVGQSPGLNLYVQGESGGTPTVTLQLTQTPNHTHPAKADTAARTHVAEPVGNCFANSSSGNLYSTSSSPLAPMNAAAVTSFGSAGPQPHNNLMPFLGLYWIIAMQGVYPPRN
jgi:microcystin-dependent protein